MVATTKTQNTLLSLKFSTTKPNRESQTLQEAFYSGVTISKLILKRSCASVPIWRDQTNGDILESGKLVGERQLIINIGSVQERIGRLGSLRDDDATATRTAPRLFHLGIVN